MTGLGSALLVQSPFGCQTFTQIEMITLALCLPFYTGYIFCIDLSILLLTFKTLKSFSPTCISDLLFWYVHSQPLKSVDGPQLVTASSQLVTKSDQVFAIRGPILWRSLPAQLRHTKLLAFLKKKKNFSLCESFWRCFIYDFNHFN